jgi:hypothetical protein
MAFMCFLLIWEQSATFSLVFLNWDRECLLRGTPWVFMLGGMRFVFKGLIYCHAKTSNQLLVGRQLGDFLIVNGVVIIIVITTIILLLLLLLYNNNNRHYKIIGFIIGILLLSLHVNKYRLIDWLIFTSYSVLPPCFYFKYFLNDLQVLTKFYGRFWNFLLNISLWYMCKTSLSSVACLPYTY